MTTTAERVEQLLADLGDTPDAVARKLAELGVKGVPGDPCNCALAQYLAANGIRADVHPGYPYGDVELSEEEFVSLPRSCNTFARGFDREEYGDLILTLPPASIIGVSR